MSGSLCSASGFICIFYRHCCFATQGINIEITLSWAHKQVSTPSHTLSGPTASRSKAHPLEHRIFHKEPKSTTVVVFTIIINKTTGTSTTSTVNICFRVVILELYFPKSILGFFYNKQYGIQYCKHEPRNTNCMYAQNVKPVVICTIGKKYGIFVISATFCILWGVYGIYLFDLHSHKEILLLGS